MTLFIRSRVDAASPDVSHLPPSQSDFGVNSSIHVEGEEKIKWPPRSTRAETDSSKSLGDLTRSIKFAARTTSNPPISVRNPVASPTSNWHLSLRSSSGNSLVNRVTI